VDEDLTFAALAPNGGLTTLAYWLGVADMPSLQDIDAVSVSRAMAYQYDIEEQADRTGLVMPEDVDWREHFVPVAPVQLTRAWSPLPHAVDMLGPPDWTSVGEPDLLGTRAAGCAWTSPRFSTLAASPTGTSDRGRFHRLLVVAAMRANDTDKGVLVLAKPGWSYERRAAISAETAYLMRAAGFVVQDRHP